MAIYSNSGTFDGLLCHYGDPEVVDGTLKFHLVRDDHNVERLDCIIGDPLLLELDTAYIFKFKVSFVDYVHDVRNIPDLFFQLKGKHDDSRPNERPFLPFYVHEGRIEIISRNDTSEDLLYEEPLVSNEWIEFKLRVVVSPENGEIDLWRNGNLVLTNRGPNCRSFVESFKTAFGIYKSGWGSSWGDTSIVNERVVYFDDISIEQETVMPEENYDYIQIIYDSEWNIIGGKKWFPDTPEPTPTPLPTEDEIVYLEQSEFSFELGASTAHPTLGTGGALVWYTKDEFKNGTRINLGLYIKNVGGSAGAGSGSYELVLPSEITPSKDYYSDNANLYLAGGGRSIFDGSVKWNDDGGNSDMKLVFSFDGAEWTRFHPKAYANFNLRASIEYYL